MKLDVTRSHSSAPDISPAASQQNTNTKKNINLNKTYSYVCAGLLYACCKIANTKNTNGCKIQKTGLRIPDVCTKDMKRPEL